MEYESKVNERQIQTTEEKTDTSNAFGCIGMLVQYQFETMGQNPKRAGYKQQIMNDAHVDDHDIRPYNAEEPMARKDISAPTQQRLKVLPQMVQRQISANHCERNKLLNVSAGTALKYRYIVQKSYRDDSDLVAKKKISQKQGLQGI
ncbi:hypothetical protein Tco_0121485 [Tanacetum coccineum]